MWPPKGGRALYTKGIANIEKQMYVVQAWTRPLDKRSESPEGKLAKGLGVFQVTLGKR